MSDQKDDSLFQSVHKRHLGTFSGVFTPSILTILGIILFLRLGYVVGQAGLLMSLAIIALANAVSILTSISLSAIATNMKVKGGGDYYLISRTLGLEFGGAIGIVLFLAQSISIGFYCVGFGEAVAGLLPGPSWLTAQLIGTAAIVMLFVLAWLGADWATKFQYLVMGILTLALISFFVGGALKWDPDLIFENFTLTSDTHGFWIVFAVFFPAVTGFTQGVSMSGDLKDPGRSLPAGTFAAVGVSILVYFVSAVLLAGSTGSEVLRENYLAMQEIAVSKPLIMAGVIAATLSSGMASFLGAPRILQSLAGDRVFPALLPFAKGYGPMNNPRRSVLLSAGIALGTTLLGQLNLIASVVSMFFLVSYGLLNYATYFEAKSKSPSFRPSFRLYNKYLSLIGALGCLVFMLLINLGAAIAALGVLAAIYNYLKRTAGPALWADSQRSYHLQQVRDHLWAASGELEHPRHWRPQILAFSDNPERRRPLLEFCEWISGQSGVVSIVRILEGDGLAIMKKKVQAREEINQKIQEHGFQAFPLVISAPELKTGLGVLLQSYGVGPLQANTVVLNWFERQGADGQSSRDLAMNLRNVFRLRFNIVLLDFGAYKWSELKQLESRDRRIDVWWWGGATSRFMLILSYLASRHSDWEDCKIRVLALASKGSCQEQEEKLETILKEYRISAEFEIVDNPDAVSIVNYSKDAAFVLLPFSIRREKIQDPFGGELNWLSSRLPALAFCLAAEDIELDAQPDEGRPAELAEISRVLDEAQKRVSKVEKEYNQAEKDLEQAKQRLEQADGDEAEQSSRESLQTELQQAEQVFKEVRQRFLKEKAKLEEAEQRIKKIAAD